MTTPMPVPPYYRRQGPRGPGKAGPPSYSYDIPLDAGLRVECWCGSELFRVCDHPSDAGTVFTCAACGFDFLPGDRVYNPDYGDYSCDKSHKTGGRS